MKTKLLVTATFLLLILPVAVFSQDKAISDFFDKYSQIDGITYVNFQGLKAKTGNEDIDNLTKNINSVKILTSEQHIKSKEQKKIPNIDLYAEAIKSLPLKNYEKFLEVKEKGTNFQMLYKTKNDKVNEMLMIVKENKETTVIWIDGSIDLNDLSKIPNLIGMQKNKKSGAVKGDK
jgi:hypothetical protein